MSGTMAVRRAGVPVPFGLFYRFFSTFFVCFRGILVGIAHSISTGYPSPPTGLKRSSEILAIPIHPKKESLHAHD
jgi:hypothetical protein